MEFVKLYLKKNDNSIESIIVDVNDVPHYVNMGWSLEEPKVEIKKNISKKEIEKEEE